MKENVYMNVAVSFVKRKAFSSRYLTTLTLHPSISTKRLDLRMSQSLLALGQRLSSQPCSLYIKSSPTIKDRLHLFDALASRFL